MYILTTKRKEANANRLVVKNGFDLYFDTIEEAEQAAKKINRERYVVEIFDGKWKFVKEI